MFSGKSPAATTNLVWGFLITGSGGKRQRGTAWVGRRQLEDGGQGGTEPLNPKSARDEGRPTEELSALSKAAARPTPVLAQSQLFGSFLR